MLFVCCVMCALRVLFFFLVCRLAQCWLCVDWRLSFGVCCLLYVVCCVSFCLLCVVWRVVCVVCCLFMLVDCRYQFIVWCVLCAVRYYLSVVNCSLIVERVVRYDWLLLIDGFAKLLGVRCLL